MFEEKEVVLLMSGGLDSGTLYIALNKVYLVKKVHVLFFNYGQSNYLQERLAVEEILVKSMYEYTFNEIELPKYYQEGEIPFRNRIFIDIASLYAVKNRINYIFYGAIDSGMNGDTLMYDCSEEFINTINNDLEYILNGVQLYAPLINFTKYEVYKFSQQLGLPIYYNCQSSMGVCGKCSNCLAMENIKKLDEEGTFVDKIIDNYYYGNPYIRLPKYRGEVPCMYSITHLLENQKEKKTKIEKS